MLPQSSLSCCWGGTCHVLAEPWGQPAARCSPVPPQGQSVWTHHLPGKVSLDPLFAELQCTFLLFSSFFHKKLKPFSVLQLSLHKPGGFSLGSEKLIQRFPLSHISTARPLSRAELGSERIVKEMGRFQCPTSAELSWNSPIKLLLPWGVGAGLWRAWRRSASHWDCTLLILQQLLPPASPWLSHPRHKVMRSWLEGALQR